MRKFAIAISVAAACLGLGVVLWYFLGAGSPSNDGIQIKFVGQPADRAATNSPFTPDDLFLKFDPRSRRTFHVTATRDCSMFVWASGVEILTSSGWKSVNEEYRGNIYRLKPGRPQQLCVERPESNEWRAYIRYSAELRGLERLKRQVRAAWRSQNFSNWTGQAWGGGFFGGSNYLTSEIIETEQ